MKNSILTKSMQKDHLHITLLYRLKKLQKLITVLLLFSLIFSLSSCVKQHGCDACIKGTFIIFNKNNENEKEHYPSKSSDKIRAKFIFDEDSSFYYGIGILGTIPQIYKKKDTSHVCIILKMLSELTVLPSVAKIECIENIE